MRIGVDIGGTKIEIAVLEDDGSEIWRRRMASPRDYQGTIAAVVRLVEAAELSLGGSGTVGIGLPGTISAGTGLVKNANSTWLIGHPLDRDLAEALGRPVTTMNDANCFALSEATDGAGAGAGVVFGVILGTGVGGGIVVDGRIHAGRQGIAGEWGHNPLPRPRSEELPGPDCYCGRSGCIETFLSGPGMVADHLRCTGETRSSHQIAASAEGGCKAAVETLGRYVERLGRSLGTVVNILDPDVIVLGGGMSNLSDLPERARRAMEPHLFTDRPDVVVRRNLHGDSSGVRGAAWLGAAGQLR
jgi:fructokinase